MKNYKAQLIMVVISLLIGFVSGRHGQSETKIVEKQESLIKNLQSKLTILKQENLKVSTKTIIIKKPDGSVITTKTKNVEKFITTHKDLKKDSELKSEMKMKDKTVTNVYSNAVGIKPMYDRYEGFETEAYLQSGLKCFVFRCYVEAGYQIVKKRAKVSSGIEYRF